VKSNTIHRFISAFFLIFSFFLFHPLDVQAQQFGKNKVQYRDFSWKFIKTKHFDVYFHEEGEYLARFAGIHAERALNSSFIIRTMIFSKRMSCGISCRKVLVV
jgi:hypothetical protein